MRRFFTEMGGVVERHGGTIEKFMGDEVMALFGVPVLHEDDVLRAARAALEMRTVLEVLNEELASRWDIRLSAHTGLNTGDVVAGMRAEGEGLTYGDAINVAQRLEAAAAPGEILVGATTARLLRGRARLTAIAPLRLKGKSNLIDAWRLEDVDVDSRPGAPVAPTRPLVGRRAELSGLRDTFNAVGVHAEPQRLHRPRPAGPGREAPRGSLVGEGHSRCLA